MSIYYKRNAMCDYAMGNSPQSFYSAIGDLWILLYGNKKDKAPKMIAVVSEVDNITDYSRKAPLPNEENALGMAYKLINLYGDIAFISFRYIKGNFNECKDFYGNTITLNELFLKYKNSGLDVINSSTKKYVNQYTSSGFHDWQRKELGYMIIATDFDLIGLNAKLEPEVVYELKRSKKYNWTPYPDDYNNFQLLYNFCQIANIDFILVFNRYYENNNGTQGDDLSIISAFYFVLDDLLFSYKQLGSFAPVDLLNKRILSVMRIKHKLCPYCRGTLVIKKGKYGKSDFYACPNYNVSCNGYIASVNEVDKRL